MRTVAVFILMILISGVSAEEQAVDRYTLSEVISYGLKNNSKIRSAEADVEIEASGIRSAQADRLPRLDLTAGASKYHYPTAITPIYGTPPSDLHFPEFDTTIYDAGVSFTLPLYRGGRLYRGVKIAELRKSIAEDMYAMSKQELVYNLTSAYYKILQLEKFLHANEETATQLEIHKKRVELFYRAGTVAKVELLKTETELAHANQAALISKNSLESAYELLKTLMGVEDMNRKIDLVEESGTTDRVPYVEDAMARAFLRRPDYQAALKRQQVSLERVGLAGGRRLPSLSFSTDYTERTGADIDFKGNWTLGLRLTMPLFEGGAISSDVSRARMELEKAKEEERLLRLEITRQIRDAYLNIENAAKRIDVADKAIESARENLRIEQLRYRTGAGTSTDVIDAQTAMLRAENDYYQALYDKAIALASLRKAMGEDYNFEGVGK